MMATPTRSIGELAVSPIVLGCGAGWAFADEPDDDRAIALIHAALDCGITMLDTARAYTNTSHPGYSESVIKRALAAHPLGSRTIVTTKGGHYRDGGEFPIDGRPETIRRHCELSLELLGVGRIDLYQLHCPDPDVPFETSVAALGRLQEEGLVRYVGLNSIDVAQLEQARALIPVATVMASFGPANQTNRELLDRCASLGIGFLAFSALRPPPGPSPVRRGSSGRYAAIFDGPPPPPFSLREEFPASAAVAAQKGISLERLVLAWVLSLAPTNIVVSGPSRQESLRDTALAGEVVLTDDDIARLDFSRGPQSLTEGT